MIRFNDSDVSFRGKTWYTLGILTGPCTIILFDYPTWILAWKVERFQSVVSTCIRNRHFCLYEFNQRMCFIMQKVSSWRY